MKLLLQQRDHLILSHHHLKRLVHLLKAACRRSVAWALRCAFRCCFRITLSYEENFSSSASKKMQTQIYVSNHESLLDGILLSAFILRHENVSPATETRAFVFPFSIFLNLVEAIPIGKTPTSRAKGALKCRDALFNRSILVFAQGGREPPQKKLNFQRGAFLLARFTEKPIRPVKLNGTFAALPRGKIFPKLGTRIQISFGTGFHPQTHAEIENAILKLGH